MATIDRTRRAVPAQAGTRIPSAARDKRPALAALAVLLILGGALASGLLVYRSGDRTDVLVASHDLVPGQRIGASDLRTARVAAEGGIDLVPAASERNFLDTQVVSRVPAGTLITAGMFRTAKASVPAGAEEVGINVGSGRQPARELSVGDVVRLYRVGGEQATSLDADVLAQAALITRVESGDSDSSLISVIVPTATAPSLIQAASAGQISLTLLPPNTKPQIDNR